MRSRLAPLSFLTLCLVSGCAFTFALGQPARPLAGRLSAGAVRLKVPYVPQEAPYLCGLACVDMLTRYYRLPLSARRRAALAAAARAQGGLSGADLKAALEAAGYFVVVFPGGLDHGAAGVYGQLDQGRPVLLMLGARQRHYCVLAGYDQAFGTVDLLDPDPDRGELLLGRTRCEERWAGANHFSLLAFPESLVDPNYSGAGTTAR